MSSTNTSSRVDARTIIKSALPISSFYFTEILVGLTDLAVIGALGTTHLAAAGLAKSLLLSVMTIGFAFLSIGAVIMAERPTPSRCGVVVFASVVLAGPFAIFALIIGLFGHHVLMANGYDPDLVGYFNQYGSVLALAIAPALVFAIHKNVLNAVNRTGVVAWISLWIVLTNLVASVVLVHGIGPWAGIGIAGAAWATVAVNMLAALALFWIVKRRKLMRFDAVTATAFGNAVKQIATLGWAAGAQQALESVLFVAVLYLLGLYSVTWLAAGAVVFAVMELNYAMSGALGEVLSARIAWARAQARYHVLPLLRLGAVLAASAALLLALMAALFSEQLIWLFSARDATPEARRLMANLLQWTAAFFVFDALQIVVIQMLRGLRRTVLPMILSSSCYWLVGLGGGMALAGPLGFGASGLWAGFCAGLACAAVLLSAMAFWFGSRQ